jgi:N4-bis(aminopropyl)spermidine synthase
LADAKTIVADVADAVGLSEGRRDVRDVLAALARLEPTSTRRLSRAAGLPVPIVASVCGELRKRDVVAQERPAQLTDVGRALFARGALVLPATSASGERSGGGSVIPAALAPSIRDLARAAKSAPQPRLDLDQCHVTVETKLRRVLALHEADALVGRRILLLGDDDLTSLAIDSVVRRFGSASTVAYLAVLDIDPSVLAFARRRLRRSPFPVSFVEHDVREPLPPGLAGRFDTVLTDPPYTAAGARLFLSRAVDALASGGTVFLSFGSRRAETSFAVQCDLARMGLVIRSLAVDFNRYVGAGVLGGTSHLYQLSATSELRPLVSGAFRGPLYTAESR